MHCKAVGSQEVIVKPSIEDFGEGEVKNFIEKQKNCRKERESCKNRKMFGVCCDELMLNPDVFFHYNDANVEGVKSYCIFLHIKCQCDKRTFEHWQHLKGNIQALASAKKSAESKTAANCWGSCNKCHIGAERHG